MSLINLNLEGEVLHKLVTYQKFEQNFMYFSKLLTYFQNVIAKNKIKPCEKLFRVDSLDSGLFLGVQYYVTLPRQGSVNM